MPTITVPIFADGDQERLSELKRAVMVAERYALANAGAPLRGGDATPDEAVQEAWAAYDAAIDEASPRAEEWVLQSIGFRQFRNLLKAHPPRKVAKVAEDGTVSEAVDPEDKDFDFNSETLPEALLTFTDPGDATMRTVAELKRGKTNIATNAEKLAQRIDRLSEGQFDTLWTKALLLNKAGVSDPKLDRFSPDTLRSSET